MARTRAADRGPDPAGAGGGAGRGLGPVSRPLPAAVLVLATLGLVVAAADAYAVATLLPRMLADTDLPIDRIEQATPIISGFLAGYVVAMPLLGALSDRRGRLPVYAGALAVFVAGSLLTALAPNLGWLVAGRAVSGLGGGALVPLTIAMAADRFAGAARDRALGAVAAAQEAGSVVGPAYGALLAGLAPAGLGWRFVFLLNLPIAFLVGAGMLLVRRGRAASAPQRELAKPRRPFGSPWSRLRDSVEGADLVSAGALGLGLGALVVALYPDDPGRGPVNSRFPVLAVAALLLLALYAWRQVRRLSPLVPRRVLRSPAFSGALITNLLVGGGLMTVLVDVPVFARGVFGVSQAAAGLLLTSFLVGVPVGAGLGGLAAARLGRRAVSVAGLLLAGGGFWLLAQWGLHELGLHVLMFRRADVQLFGLGAAFGLVAAPIAAAALEATEHAEHGLVSSLVVTARTVGMLLALSALTAFGLYRFHRLLAEQPRPPDSASLHDRLKALEHAVTQALLLEYHDIFRIAAALCVVAAVVAAVTLGRRPPGAAARG